MSQEDVQTYLGYNGVFYADQKRRERLDRKIEALEVELARLKQLRRGMPQ